MPLLYSIYLLCLLPLREQLCCYLQVKFSRISFNYGNAITVGLFFHVQPEDTTYNVMSTRHFFVFSTEFKVVLTYFKWFVISVSFSLNILSAAHLAACKATAVSRIQAHPSFLPHSTVAILGSTLSLFTLV
jgi:hypothetical protein